MSTSCLWSSWNGKGRRMRNPLRKRLLRELREELGKYLVIFLLLSLTIGLISGFDVADGSMIAAYDESFEKYNIEDGNFRVAQPLNRAQIKLIQAEGVKLYPLYSVDDALTNESTLRIYENRDEVNLVCVMKGALPSAPDEIAVDRMYADNRSITDGKRLDIGDTLSDGQREWRVTGLVALSDYSSLFSGNSDAMFDAVQFGVGVVTEEGFAAFGREETDFRYAWKYNRPPADESEERERAEALMKVLAAETELEDYIPRYANQAIQFTGEDMGSDRAMMMILLYIIIAIMAFVFAITISNTISREANVIGTLRASGYTRGELVRHYMTLPLLVTLAGALVGNVLGYTFFKDFCAGMYYGSYSLPTYVTRWNADAFRKTTIVPLALMAAINYCILTGKLTLSPLKFLRRDLKRRPRQRAFPLSRRIPFFARFRLRVILQNRSSYAMLFVGILFANLLLMFGLGLPDCLDNYQASIEQNMLSSYQYILTVPLSAMDESRKLKSLLSMLQFRSGVETEHPDAEQFTAYTLKTLPGAAREEEVMLYGVQPDSRYIPIQAQGDEVYISSAYADKFLLEPGDTITLKEVYEDDTYTFRIVGVYDYMGALAVFMSQQAANERFDLGADYFSGYFSATEITDINQKYIGTVIDMNALTKISRQLDVSMGSMMYLVDGFAVVIFLILIYLLSKLMIEKNAQSISMTKILGYTNREIAGLYLLSTSVMVLLFLLVSIPVMYRVLVVLFRVMMMQEMTGWIPLTISKAVYVKMFLLGAGSYAVVAVMEYRRIRAVPMDEALKNVE